MRNLKSPISCNLFKNRRSWKEQIGFFNFHGFRRTSGIKRSIVGSSRFKVYRDPPNAPSPYVSWIRRSVVATFGESFRSHRILLSPSIAHDNSEKSKCLRPLPFSLFRTRQWLPRGTNVRHGRQGGAASGYASVIRREGERVGEKGIATLPEERVARERRDTRCAPPRRRSVAFG